MNSSTSGQDRFSFSVNGREYAVDNGTANGRKVLQTAGLAPASDYALIRLTRPGSRVVGLDEDVDLATPGRENFRAFLTDREFNFTIDEIGYAWGAATITEEELRFVSVTAPDKELVLDRDDLDRVIEAGSTVDLAGRGTEHIHTERRLITVYYKDDPFELARGRYTGAQLAAKFKVPNGYVLDLVKPDGEFKEIPPQESLKIREGMHFVSHPPCGQSS